MIKRVPAILFIILANIVLLAHAFIPHHHHEKEVCIVSSHCESDSDSHNHDSANHKHHHHGENNVDGCVLQQILISPQNKIKHEIKRVNLDNDLFHTDSFQALLIGNHFVLASFLDLPKTEPPILFFTYQNYAGKVTGMRAPPLV